MANEPAWIVIAQAEMGEGEAGHVEAAPVGAENAESHAETLGEQNLEQAETGMPQLDFGIYPNLIFWLLVAIVALYLILSRIALPRIGNVLAERTDAITNDIEMAALYKRRAVEAEAAYNAALAQARDEAHKIAAAGKAAIDKELAVLMAKANAEIAAQTTESEGRIRAIQADATQSVEEVARATVRDIVATLMPQLSPDPAEFDAAVSARLKG